MAFRVTQTDVAAIVAITAGVDATLFISMANMIVNEELAPRGVLSAQRLFEIERYLAAHFYAVQDPQSQSESAGVSVSYEGSASENLKRTRYGQQAIVLDTTGRLNVMNMGKRPATMITLGPTRNIPRYGLDIF